MPTTLFAVITLTAAACLLAYDDDDDHRRWKWERNKKKFTIKEATAVDTLITDKWHRIKIANLERVKSSSNISSLVEIVGRWKLCV